MIKLFSRLTTPAAQNDIRLPFVNHSEREIGAIASGRMVKNPANGFGWKRKYSIWNQARLMMQFGVRMLNCGNPIESNNFAIVRVTSTAKKF